MLVQYFKRITKRIALGVLGFSIISTNLYAVELNEKSIVRLPAMDVVIPVAPKDKVKLKKSLQGILDNSLTPIHNVYIIANDKSILDNLNIRTNVKIIFIAEDRFPFSKKDIEKILHQKQSKHPHTSWYYQQLLKFYVFKIIKNLSQNVLILDSDFVFKNKVKFLTDDGKAILAYGYPFKWILNTTQYPTKIEHSHVSFAKKFVPEWEAMNSFSGMQHHMLFQEHIISSLFERVETYHEKDFWKAFIDTVDVNKWNAASEYVIYFHFAIKNYPKNLEVRHLNAYDIIHDSQDENNDVLSIFDELIHQSNHNAVGCHAFLNLKERLKTMDYIPEKLREEMIREKHLCFILELDNGMLQISSYNGFKNRTKT
jgi:hypothetical protein